MLLLSDADVRVRPLWPELSLVMLEARQPRVCSLEPEGPAMHELLDTLGLHNVSLRLAELLW